MTNLNLKNLRSLEWWVKLISTRKGFQIWPPATEKSRPTWKRLRWIWAIVAKRISLSRSRTHGLRKFAVTLKHRCVRGRRRIENKRRKSIAWKNNCINRTSRFKSCREGWFMGRVRKALSKKSSKTSNSKLTASSLKMVSWKSMPKSWGKKYSKLRRNATI